MEELKNAGKCFEIYAAHPEMGNASEKLRESSSVSFSLGTAWSPVSVFVIPRDVVETKSANAISTMNMCFIIQ